MLISFGEASGRRTASTGRRETRISGRVQISLSLLVRRALLGLLTITRHVTPKMLVSVPMAPGDPLFGALSGHHRKALLTSPFSVVTTSSRGICPSKEPVPPVHIICEPAFRKRKNRLACAPRVPSGFLSTAMPWYLPIAMARREGFRSIASEVRLQAKLVDARIHLSGGGPPEGRVVRVGGPRTPAISKAAHVAEGSPNGRRAGNLEFEKGSSWCPQTNPGQRRTVLSANFSYSIIERFEYRRLQHAGDDDHGWDE